MLLRRFYDEQLAQASYLIGCTASGTALVIDPNRNVDQYIAAAEAEVLTITAVTETHIHADFVSGVRELAARAGATMYLSAMGTPEWQYRFGGEPGVRLLRDRDRIAVGNVTVQAAHTPGHTPEHLSFLVTDAAQADEPMGIATGDFMFVSDVGRPDLLEKAAKVAGASEGAARDLFQSLAWFKTLPDHLQIWPGHGAGSACGKGLSAVPQSTVGYERRYNWAFGVEDEAEFVRQVLAGQPEPPPYFGVMKRVNREGPRVLGGVDLPERVSESRIGALLEAGAIVVDTRHAPDFAAGHIPGTVSLPYNRSFLTYAGSVLPYDRDLHLIVDAERRGLLAAVLQGLQLIGLDRVRGYAGLQALDLWAAARPLEVLPQMTVEELGAGHGRLLVLDVRGRSEWDAGHLPGARLLPLPELPERLAELPTNQEIAVHCAAGTRSAIAASLLRASGRSVMNVVGGFEAWVRAGLPVARD